MNTHGMLGDGSQTSSRVPVAVATQLRFSSISIGDGIQQPAGIGHTCALTDDGTAYCWGLNDRGQLGDGTTTDRHVPTAAAGGIRFTALELGEYSTCGMRGESVWCWGGNDRGQLGDGTTVNRSVPVLIGGQID
jgi:alpha-tubulin suppressor-like RCC1 family protein